MVDFSEDGEARELREVLGWFEAARVGDEATLERMLAEGFWAEAPSPLDGMTALMVAAQEGQLGCVRLLASESDVDARDGFGNTAALVAAAQGQEDALAILAAAGADLGLRNAYGLGVEAARQRAAAKGRKA